MAGRKKEMSGVTGEWLSQVKTLIMDCCIVQKWSFIGVATVYSFSLGRIKWHISSGRLCSRRDLPRFEWLQHASTEETGEKALKEKCPASEKLMTCSARLSGRMAAVNLKLSDRSLTNSQNSQRCPVWFPQSLDHIASPRHLQVSSPVWLQSDKTRERKYSKPR